MNNCRNCGTQTAVIPLERYPIPAEELVQAMEAASTCVACGGTELFLDQSAEAYRWFDETHRQPQTED